MYNKTFRSPEGMFRDRIDKDHGRLASTLFYRSRYNRGLDALRPGYFTPQLKTLIVGNSLSQAVPGVNLVEFYDLRKKVVQIGEGGISSADMVPMSARNVHPTQLGVVDFLKAPESRSVGIDQRFAAYAKLGPEGQVYTKVIDAKTGKPVWRTPSQLYGKVIQFPDSSDLPFLEA
jgi:DNA-directed RNA polymerase beta subunit